MLYDPKWEKTTEAKTDPFSLASLIAWLETQNPDTQYCYGDGGICLLNSYFTARGFKNVLMGGNFMLHGQMWTSRDPISKAFEKIAVRHPRTFGGALARARSWNE